MKTTWLLATGNTEFLIRITRVKKAKKIRIAKESFTASSCSKIENFPFKWCSQISVHLVVLWLLENDFLPHKNCCIWFCLKSSASVSQKVSSIKLTNSMTKESVNVFLSYLLVTFKHLSGRWFDKLQYRHCFLAAKLLRAEAPKSGCWKGILSLLEFEPVAIVKEHYLPSTSNFNISNMLPNIHTSFSKVRESLTRKSGNNFSFDRGSNKEP